MIFKFIKLNCSKNLLSTNIATFDIKLYFLNELLYQVFDRIRGHHDILQCHKTMKNIKFLRIKIGINEDFSKLIL